jgi:hypothetical protein
MRQEVKEEMPKWRDRFVWQHENGKAIKTTPAVQIPITKDEDLQSLWQRLWEQERLRTQEEEEAIQKSHDSEAAEEQRQQRNLEDWSMEELWDEILELTRSIRRGNWIPKIQKEKARREELRRERDSREQRERVRGSHRHYYQTPTSDLERELLVLDEWLQKYENCEFEHMETQRDRRREIIQELKQRKIQAERKAKEKEKEEKARLAALAVMEEEKKKERLRRVAEEKLKREVKMRFYVWKLQMMWKHEEGRAFRIDPPFPTPKGEEWMKLWEM